MNSTASNQQKPFDILVVDDTQTNLKLLAELLSAQGYHVRPATSGELALRSIKAAKPDLILLDVKMTGIDGYEVCKRLKADESTGDIPVIFISALDDETSKVTGFEVGGVDFISKPFRKEEVLARVKTHLDLNLLQRELKTRNQILEEEILIRKTAESALQESEERFSTTLYSIGDGVITTDVKGRVIMMNWVAEKLTGWKQEEATGIILEEVFNIINETSRLAVEIPIRKVIREGVIVGLANHTLLIAKNGTEYPIADSGAPIRNKDGEITGMVLVFRDQTEERKISSKLEASEGKFKSMIESSPMGMHLYELHPNGKLILIGANPSADKMLGIDHQKQIGKTIQEAFPNLANTNVPEMYSKVANGEMDTQQFEIEYHDEQQINGFFSVTVFQSGENFVTVQFIDISEQKNAELAIKKSEELFHGLFEHATVGFSMTQPGGEININPAFANMLGYEPEELMKMNWKEITHPDDIQASMDVIELLLSGKQDRARYEKRFLHKTGAIVWTDLSTKLLRDEKGEPLYFITNINDLTKRKKAEQQLMESEIRSRSTFDQSPVGSVIVGLDKRFIKCNSAFCSFLGYSEEEMIGKTIPQITFPEDKEIGMLDLKLMVEGKKESSTVWKRYVRKDGAIVWGEVSISLVRDQDNNPMYFLPVIQDITERKNAEEMIQKERTLLRTLIDHLPDTVYVNDLEGRKLIANKAYIEFIGKSFKEVIKKTDIELFEGEVGQHGFDDDMRVMQTGEPMLNVEEIFIDNHGVKRWFVTSKIPLRDSVGKVYGLVGTGRDMTGKHRDFETIQKLTKSIEQSPSTIVITDTQGTIEYVNPKFTEITGYSPEEAIGENPRILKSGEMPAEEYKELWDIISTGGVWRGEFHNRKKNGELYWEWATITSIKDDRANIINYMAIKEDISLRKQMETDLLVARDKAEENDRLKSAFLANMSHEIRTPLNCILGFTEMMTDPDTEYDQLVQYSRLIITSGNDLLSVINDILDISKIESGQVRINKSKFPIQRIIKEVVNLFENKANEQGVLLRIAPDLIKKDILIESDDAKLKQVLTNFVSNALKFTEVGSIEIGVKNWGDILQLFVSDTGIGISKEFHSTIFERFRQVETAHTRKYGGNGLGLAISKSLIEMLGGTIGMESEVGKGSTFYFTIPKQI